MTQLLWDALGDVPDRRGRQGRQYELRSVLGIALAAMLAGANDLRAIWRWGRRLRPEALRLFGIESGRSPCHASYHYFFQALDADALAATLGRDARGETTGGHIALDGKTLRGSRRLDAAPLHVLSAFATELGAVIPDQVGDRPRRAARGLAVKANQQNLHAEVARYFDSAPAAELDTAETLGKDHGRIEIRRHRVSRKVDWISSDRTYPDAPRFENLAAVAMVEATIERKGKVSTERRYYISSRALTAAAFSEAVRSHWAIENSLHWTLVVTFKEDLSRLRAGHGARNMAIVRHFAFNLVRQIDDDRSLKTRRKAASWDPNYLQRALQILTR
jgi:predicted transposase YbfD/YdcC